MKDKLKTLLLVTFFYAPDLRAQSVIGQLQELDAVEFSEREKAQGFILKRLNESPETVSKSLIQHYLKSDSPEVRSRIRLMLTHSEKLKLHVVAKKHGVAKGFVGVGMNMGVRQINGVDHGVVIVDSIHPKSPAERHGVLVGDAIWGVDEVRFGKQALAAQNAFTHYVAMKKPLDQILLKVLRGEEILEITVTLTARYIHISQLGNRPEALLAREKELYFYNWLEKQLMGE